MNNPNFRRKKRTFSQYQAPREELSPTEVNFSQTDTSNSERKIWLVKIPNYLTNAWETVPNGTELGNIEINSETQEKNLKVSDSFDLPKEYSIDFQPQAPAPMYIFSSTEAGATSFQGIVENKGDFKPKQIDDKYRQLIRGRTESTSNKGRSSQPIDQQAVHKGAKILKNNSTLAQTAAQPKQKRSRMEKGTLIKLLFSYFERQEYWTLKALVDETNQPPAFLKEVLQELAIFHKRGEHNAQYQLKGEYKNQSVKPEPKTE